FLLLCIVVSGATFAQTTCLLLLGNLITDFGAHLLLCIVGGMKRKKEEGKRERERERERRNKEKQESLR
ncbi:MAG: hypothetical protein K2W95_31075, partial [Candidatus Obscuribacterales bacterium]|nr:hypothetical protein [Candidatus Obscuribacterales bacterium]